MLCKHDRLFVFKPFVVEKVPIRAARNKPKPRSGHRVVCNLSNLYSFGGYNPSLADDRREDPPNPLFRELWSFCFARRTWRLHQIQDTIPEELASNAVCLNGKSMMVYGGTGTPFGHRCSNNVYTYDVTGGQGGLQIVNTEGQKPLPQYGQSIICHDGYLYTIGGTNGFLYTCDIHRLDLRTLLWEVVYICCGNRLDEPAGRYRHELAFDGANLYILAGGTAEWAFDFTEIPVFNLETMTWSFQPSKPDPTAPQPGIPAPRKCHSAVQINSNNNILVYVIGGSEGETVFSDIWQLKIPSLQWTLMKKCFLPKALHFHSSAITPAGCMYTFGGIQSEGEDNVRTNKLYKSWLCIPKLSEMCWESMLFYFPSLVDFDKAKLLQVGIPLEFVERLKP